MRKMLDQISEKYPDYEFLVATGFNSAVIGVYDDVINDAIRLVYSNKKCINILIKRDKMSYEDALEYFNFNVTGAYVGEKTPIWVDDI